MRHQCRVPELGRPADQRKALLRSLTTELIRNGQIKTTQARAKAVRRHAERAIELAKDGSLAARRRALGYIYDKNWCRLCLPKPASATAVAKAATPALSAPCGDAVIMPKWRLSSWFSGGAW